MPRTPSYLKGLIETRARAAGDLSVRRHAVAVAAAKLKAAELALAQASTSLLELRERQAEAEQELADCDRLIRKASRSVDPTKLDPVRAHDRYGHRGALTEAVCGYFKAHAGRTIPTPELLDAIAAQFGLVFSSPQERQHWKEGSLLRAVKTLVAAGLVEGLHGRKHRAGFRGQWRWKGDAPSSLAEIEARARAAGGAIVRAAAED